MKKSHLLVSAAVAGILLGAQGALAHETQKQASEEGKNGCKGKNSCKGKKVEKKKEGAHTCGANTCSGANACSGPNGCDGKEEAAKPAATTP